MLSALSPALYIQLTPRTLTIRNVRTGAFLSEAADIAIATREPKYRVVAAYGSAARTLQGSANVQLISPFAHPRSIVHQFDPAEVLLRLCIKQVLGMRWLALRPTVVMHPLGHPEGGFTDIELRTLRELALGAGARKAHVWVGRALTDAEVLAAPLHCGQGQWF